MAPHANTNNMDAEGKLAQRKRRESAAGLSVRTYGQSLVEMEGAGWLCTDGFSL